MTDPDAFVAEAGAIFEGMRIERTVVEEASPGTTGFDLPKIVATFKVFTAYKGSLGPTVRITYTGQDGVNCGAAFKTGEKETIILFGDPKRGYTTDMCGQAAIANSREEILAAAAYYRNRLLALHRPVVFRQPWAALAEARFLAKNNAATEALALLADFENDWRSEERDATLLASELHVSLAEDELALQALDRYLASTPYDPLVYHARILLLIRLNRASEVPPGWRDFTDLDAAVIDFSGRDLEGASFRNLKSSVANFSNSRLAHADFSGAYMSPLFSGAKVQASDFSNAELAGANFRGASVWGNFKGANLTRAWLTGAELRIELADAVMEGADARGAKFYGHAYDRLNARNLLAAGAYFNGASFDGADFSGADLRAAAFSYVKLTNAILANTDLRMTSFEGSDLTGANLTGARYDDKTVWPAGFDPDKAGAKRE